MNPTTKKLKVLLINISLRPNSDKLIFPIGIGYIATAIKLAGFELEILDLDILKLPSEELKKTLKQIDFDVVTMGCIVTGYKYVKELSKIIKECRDVPIIVGNSVATSIPKILLGKTAADIGIIGEGDITIVELLHALEQGKSIDNIPGIFYKKNGEIKFTKERPLIPNLDNLPFINYDLFNMEVYLKKYKLGITKPYPIEFEKITALPINTARGCPFNCTFCYHVFKNKKYRYRSAQNISKEISLLKNKYGVNYVEFFDELTLFSKKRVAEIADTLLQNNPHLFWVGDCRGDLFGENDLALAKKLKQSGCVCLGYSLESADENILKTINKKMSVEQFKTQTRILKEAGIPVITSLVLGYPEETLESLQKTFDVCYESGIYPSAGYLLPQPGTPMYEYAKKMGKIQDEEEYLLNIGDRQDLHINLTQMSNTEMEGIVKENLDRISKKMGLGLTGEKLIKTGGYNSTRIEE